MSETPNYSSSDYSIREPEGRSIESSQSFNRAIEFSFTSNDEEYEASYNSVKHILKMLINNELITDGDNDEILNELNNRILFDSVNSIYFMPRAGIAHLLKSMERTRELVKEQKNKNRSKNKPN